MFYHAWTCLLIYHDCSNNVVQVCSFIKPWTVCSNMHGQACQQQCSSWPAQPCSKTCKNKLCAFTCVYRWCMRVCFGRLASAGRILCIWNFQSRKPNNYWLWKYKFGEKSKSRDGFWIWRTRLNLGFCSIFFKFWDSSYGFVKGYFV